MKESITQTTRKRHLYISASIFVSNIFLQESEILTRSSNLDDKARRQSSKPVDWENSEDALSDSVRSHVKNAGINLWQTSKTINQKLLRLAFVFKRIPKINFPIDQSHLQSANEV